MRVKLKSLFYLTMISVFLVFVDVSLSGTFSVYFSLIFIAFCIAETNDIKLVVALFIITGIFDDIFFAGYVGPFVLSYFVVFGIHYISKTYFHLPKAVSYFADALILVTLISSRFKFRHLPVYAVSTIIFSALLYPVFLFLFEIVKKPGENAI